MPDLTLKPAPLNGGAALNATRREGNNKNTQNTMKIIQSTPEQDLAEFRRMNAARLAKNYPAYPKNARLKASGGHYTKNRKP